MTNRCVATAFVIATTLEGAIDPILIAHLDIISLGEDSKQLVAAILEDEGDVGAIAVRNSGHHVDDPVGCICTVVTLTPSGLV